MICAVLGFGLPALVCATIVAVSIVEADDRQAQRDHEARMAQREKR